jgi:UDP-GlcNAc3NAcA epimerase
MPEEINRITADHLSDLLFAPTQLAVQNLANEGIRKGVHMVGDVMFDSTLFMMEAAKRESTIVNDLGLAPGAFVLATLHRASTTDQDGSLAKAIDFLKSSAAGKIIVLPLHPRTRAAAKAQGVSLEQISVIDPVGPMDMHGLLAACAAVYTDSGGVQKEAYFHKKPCVTIRETTEWIETIESGWNRLWTVPEYKSPRHDIPDYGLGKASEKIVLEISTFLR